MTGVRVALSVVFLLSVVAAALAQSPDLIDADRPGLADTGSVIGKGRWQIEAGVQWESRGNETSQFIPLLFRVGLTDRFEARIEGNSFTTAVADGVRQSGVQTASIGFKLALQDAEEQRPGFGLIARLLPAWGSGGFETRHATGDVRLAVDWNFTDHLSLNPNGGIGWYEGEAGTFPAGVFALTLTYAPKPGVAWFVDTGVQAPEAEGGATSIIVDGGVAYIPRQNWQFDISVGTRAHGETPARPFIAVGVAFRHK